MFQQAGLDRMKLSHDIAEWERIDYLPQVSKRADELGYLLGPYDSYGSIHDPQYYGTDQSWYTAQFDQELYDLGPIVDKNGKKMPGFQRKGYWLSAKAARPWVEKRVQKVMGKHPYNYYFLDVEACGDLRDNYSPRHPMTHQEDAQARTSRIAWVSQTFKTVVGTECSSFYAAPVIHVTEGAISPAFGRWLDRDFKNPDSDYFLGKWFPPHGPNVFVQTVPLKDKFVHLNYAPQFRLPLNEVVFHDSYVSTHHWGSGSLKFSNTKAIVELTELLYLVPPLYHLNPKEFQKHKKTIIDFYQFFSPLHKKMGFSPMTDFSWLSPDRLVQKTQFGTQLEMIANFQNEPFAYRDVSIPPLSILAYWKTGEHQLYTP